MSLEVIPVSDFCIFNYISLYVISLAVIPVSDFCIFNVVNPAPYPTRVYGNEHPQLLESARDNAVISF